MFKGTPVGYIVVSRKLGEVIKLVIDVTKKAMEELVKIRNEKKTEKALRIYVAGYGWGGPSFGIALDEQKNEDIVTEIDGITFVVEREFGESFSKFTVDYSDSFLRKGFVILPDGKPVAEC